MSQVATESTTLAPNWNSDPARSANVTIEPVLKSAEVGESAGIVYRGLETRIATPASAAGCRTRISPCPFWKRAMDVLGAALALVILTPMFLGVALFIKCVSRGPVLYRQQRYGLGGRPFEVWKFRTIEVNRELDQHRSHVAELMSSDRPLEKRDHELDVIPGGALLRRFGIDELPQLINVLKGEMSLVGPRPDVVPFDHYESRHRRRFDVVPGITGLWQVCGKNRTTFSRMMQLDLAYVRRRGFWLDIAILRWTIPALAWD